MILNEQLLQMKFHGKAGEYLQLETIDAKNCSTLKESKESELTALWFLEENNELVIDGQNHQLKQNEIVFLTEFHKPKPIHIGKIRLLRFSRSFYCILNHDTEVGCKGVLFFGASQLPIIKIPAPELEKYELLWKMFSIEMESNDNLQIEMLQMMLKRYLILSTRIYKSQKKYPTQKKDADIIREFNFLVEQHFKTKHKVTEYADLLFKSPKTLSNLFLKMGTKTPLQFIQDRIMLEAKKQLNYSNLPVKEIAYDVGFDDIQSFSRFFKNQAGISPSEYKKENQRE